MNSWEGRHTVPVFKFREISLLETADIMSSLSTSTALGHDRLDALSIKGAQVHLVSKVRHLINVSLLTGKFAAKWKFARLTPQIKNTDSDKN